MLLVTSCWASPDRLASDPGGSSNAPSHFMLGILCLTSIPHHAGYPVMDEHPIQRE